MVKFVGLVLLGFAACMAAAIPPNKDSNGHSRIRRTIWNPNPPRVPTPLPDGSVRVPHGDHYDTVRQNYDGSVERTHNINNQHGRYPDYNSGHNLGRNTGNFPGFNSGQNFGRNNGNFPGSNSGRNVDFASGKVHQHDHSHDDAVIEITEFHKDKYGHDVIGHTQVYPDGHTHKSLEHIE